jgi:hypothetical protein
VLVSTTLFNGVRRCEHARDLVRDPARRFDLQFDTRHRLVTGLILQWNRQRADAA